MRSGLATAVGAFVACLATGAEAQCLLDLQTEIRGGLSGVNASTRPIVTRGTFECGVSRGTTCSAGTISGTCTQNTIESVSLSCDGTCDVAGDGTLSCAGTEVARSEVGAECVSGTCRVQGTGTGLGGSFAGVTVSDPLELEGSVQRCANGSLEETHSYGLIAVTP